MVSFVVRKTNRGPADSESTDHCQPYVLAIVLCYGANVVPRMRVCGKAGRSGPPGNANARKHGIHSLKRAVSTLGNRALDQRTAVAKALAAWRSDLIADLGGHDAVATQELALIDEAVKTKLILDSVDTWLLSQP